MIAVTYIGAQNVSLYAADIDADTATAACELASTFGLDETASISVYTGGYSDATELVAREGADDTCAPV